MQPLGDTQRLPRLLAGAGSDDLGELRPGRERVGVIGKQMSAFEIPQRRIAGRTSKPRRPYGWITMTALAALTISLFHLPSATQARLIVWLDSFAVSAGLAVDHIAVVGHNKTTMDDIASALDLEVDKSLLGFNGTDVRAKLLRLPWVNTVRVGHILPDTLSIEISERVPAAIWQHEGQHYLVDRNGHTLGRYHGDVPQTKYPLVVGKGAGVTAGSFLDAIARHPSLARQMTAGVRVADRRWNLILKSGKKILLPENGLQTALGTLEALFARKTLRGNDITVIDLRIPARPTLRLAATAAKALRDRKEARRAAMILLTRGAS